MNDAKVDEFAAMIEHAKKIYDKREDKDTTNRKRKQGEEDTELGILPILKCEMHVWML
jgi:hypothetical protein